MAIDDNTSYELTGYQVKDLAQKIRAKADASSLASVATSGLYSDLIGTPTIPTVYNGKLTIKQNGTTIDEFTANQSSDTTISLTDTTYSDFTGATSSLAGTAGLVPAPAAGDDTKFLSGNGLWTTVSQYSLPIASSSTLGGIKIGNNLTIDPLTGVLDADGSTYTAGNGIDITNNEISIDDTVVAELSDLATVATTGSYSDLLDKPTIDSTLSLSSTNAVQNKIITRFSEKLLCYGTTIAASSDLNTTPFLKIGRYYTSQSATAATFVNCPVTVAFHMDVEAPIDANYDNETTSSWVYRVRIITTLNGDKWFQEVHSNGTAGNFSYSAWKKYATSSDLAGKQNTLTAGSNIQINNNTISATDTTYSPMTGATSSTAGTAGLVPAPAAGDQDKVLSGAGTWVAQSGGGSYTAGDHIDITNNVISAEGYIWGDDAAPASTPASTITSAMIVDGTIQATDIATGVVPVITMVDTDPGEGSPLAANNFIAVYGDDPSNMNYSTTETKTGATWIDGKPVYRRVFQKTISASTSWQTVATITGMASLVKLSGSYHRTDNVWTDCPRSTLLTYINSSNSLQFRDTEGIGGTAYIIAEYTKSS